MYAQAILEDDSMSSTQLHPLLDPLDETSSKTDIYQNQHKLRLSYMPWLYFTLKPKLRAWAKPWQDGIQNHWRSLETVEIGKNCFIAPTAKLFAEPGRLIRIGDNCSIGADVVIHGPVNLGDDVSLNHHVTIEGGRTGITIGSATRIGAYSCLYGFDHGMTTARLIKDQPVSSEGITLGTDVWIGAHVGIVDGVTIGDGAIIGMGSLVTRDVPQLTKAAGNPARVIGHRE